MRKTKYFIMGFIFLLFLNSCGYIEYAYDQIKLESAENGITKILHERDEIAAINNPKYKKDIENILIDIEKKNHQVKLFLKI